jgi:hypothetical protein
MLARQGARQALNRCSGPDPFVKGIIQNADENSGSGRTKNSWYLRRVVKFLQLVAAYLHCVVLFASGMLYEAVCS